MCWDLDNTLVDTGTLLRVGTKLGDAVVDADPVPNMLAFHAELARRVPQAQHFVLSVRTRSMWPATLAWIARHDLVLGDGCICFVPSAAAKVRVWEALADAARLVIVDDLSYGHELDRPLLYADLVAAARKTARVYVGLDEIEAIAGDATAIHAVADRAVAALAASG